MLDMYTEQQSVTIQHLDKVHEEQQSIKDQQSILLKETEKSQATLNRMTTATHPKGDDIERMYQLERETNRQTSSSVPQMSARTTSTRSRYPSGSGWSDDAKQSRVTPMQTDSYNHSCKAPTQFQVNQVNVLNPNQVHAQSSSYYSSSQHGVSDDVAPRIECNRGSLNTSSHLFQHPPPNYQNQHQILSSGSAVYAMQPVMRPGSVYQPQVSSNPALSEYGEQPGSIRNPRQDCQNPPSSTSYSTGKRPSCYNHFNNKFSSPNYTSSDRQLWSKKNLKPSPVAAVAPQAHREPCGDESQDTQVASRTRKQSRQKRSRRGVQEPNQPQRKSARLSARNSPWNENGFCSSREERWEGSRAGRRKSKSKKKARSCSVAPLARENESQEDESESEDETAPTHWEEKVPSTKRGGAQTNKSMKKQPAMMKQVQKHSTVPSTSTRQMSNISARQIDSSDEDDEYSFHDDREVQPATTFKAFHTLKRSTSCGDEVKHEQHEVFTKRLVGMNKGSILFLKKQ